MFLLSFRPNSIFDGVWIWSPVSTVPSLHYEVIQLVHNHRLKRVFIAGCSNITSAPEFYKEALNITIHCDQFRCKQLATQASGRIFSSQPGYFTKHACDASTTQQALGMQIHRHDAFILEKSFCEQPQGCTRKMISAFQELAATHGCVLFITIDYNTNSMTVTHLPTRSVTRYMEAVPEGGPREVFTNIYSTGYWGKGEVAGMGSGLGSSLNFTRVLSQKLEDLIRKYKIRSMLDAPCGSLHWMRHVLTRLGPSFNYIGGDVACPVVDQLSRQFANVSNWRFYCMDMCHQPLPPGIDLVFTRDALQHMPYSYIFNFLHNVKKSGARYLLVTSYIRHGNNTNINLGKCFMINLKQAPFNLRPEPLDMIDEESPTDMIKNQDKFMLLYDVSTLQFDVPNKKRVPKPNDGNC